MSTLPRPPVAIVIDKRRRRFFPFPVEQKLSSVVGDRLWICSSRRGWMLSDPAAPFLLPLCFWGCFPCRDEAAAALRSLAQHCDANVKARLICVCVRVELAGSLVCLPCGLITDQTSVSHQPCGVEIRGLATTSCSLPRVSSREPRSRGCRCCVQ